MIKKVIIIVVLLVNFNIYSYEFPKGHFGLSLGIFYTHQDLVSTESTIESQVDSITLFLINMKMGGLFRYGYYFNPFFGIGAETGLLFNSYHLNIPLRGFMKLGISELNLKLIGGISINREVSAMGNGIDDVIVAGTVEYGLRFEFMHLYIEWINSISYSELLPNSNKISFGYSLFFPDIK